MAQLADAQNELLLYKDMTSRLHKEKTDLLSNLANAEEDRRNRDVAAALSAAQSPPRPANPELYSPSAPTYSPPPCSPILLPPNPSYSPSSPPNSPPIITLSSDEDDKSAKKLTGSNEEEVQVIKVEPEKEKTPQDLKPRVNISVHRDCNVAGMPSFVPKMKLYSRNDLDKKRYYSKISHQSAARYNSSS